jgi:hypothetical protein
MNARESKSEGNFFQNKNNTIRIDCFEKLDDSNRIPLMSFSRRIGAPHLYWEQILPTMEQGDSQIFAAIRDRPWPPWGLGAQKIYALCIVTPVSENSVGISPVIVDDEDLTNIGLIAAVYKEALEYHARGQKRDVSYLVIEGSILAHRVLTSKGFKKSADEIFLTEEARYNIYSADAKELSNELGLTQISTLDLLEYEIEDDILDRNALFHGVIGLAARPGLLDPLERYRRSEVIPIGGGMGSIFQPGGVPPGPPS